MTPAAPALARPHTELCTGWGLSLGSTREKPKGSFPQRPGDQGQAVWQSHPSTPGGRRGPCQQQLLTAVGAASSGAVGKESPGRERRHSYCSAEAAVPLHTEASRDSASQPRWEAPNTPVPPHPSTPQVCFTLEHPPRMSCDLVPGLHTKLQITFFIPF